MLSCDKVHIICTYLQRRGNDEKRSGYEQERIEHAKRIMKPFVLRRLKSEVSLTFYIVWDLAVFIF